MTPLPEEEQREEDRRCIESWRHAQNLDQGWNAWECRDTLIAVIDRQSDALRRVTQLPEDVRSREDRSKKAAKVLADMQLDDAMLSLLDFRHGNNKHFNQEYAAQIFQAVNDLADALVAANRRVVEEKEKAHYANGVADLAMKHRDTAEARVAVLESDLQNAQGNLDEAVKNELRLRDRVEMLDRTLAELHLWVMPLNDWRPDSQLARKVSAALSTGAEEEK